MRLAAQRALVHPQLRLLHQPGIRRDAIPFSEEHHISRNELLGEDFLLLSIPQHPHVMRDQLLESLGRLFRAVFLPEAERAVDEVDEPDGNRQLRHPRHERHDPSPPQQERHEMGEVAQQPHIERRAFDLTDGIGPPLLQALRHFRRGQSLRSALQRRIDFRNRQRRHTGFDIHSRNCIR